MPYINIKFGDLYTIYQTAKLHYIWPKPTETKGYVNFMAFKLIISTDNSHT